MLKSFLTARAHKERTDYCVFYRSSCALEIVPLSEPGKCFYLLLLSLWMIIEIV
jgi:hypothetical protein